jgi:ribosomal protein S27E
MTATAVTTEPSPFISLKKLSCTQCGGELELHNRRAQYVSCRYCGAVLDLNSETYQVIQQLTNPQNYPPFSFIELGVELELFDIRYIVIGRTRWQSEYKEYYEEYDDEDGRERGYSDEVWEYDEWLLLSQYKNYLYLIEDKEGFAISASVGPTAPNLPKTFAYKNINFIKNGLPGITQEYGINKIVYFEGESTYLKKKGEEAAFAMYQKKLSEDDDNLIGLENIPLEKFYGATIDCVFEWRMDSQQKLKEIEFFVEIPVSKDLLGSAVIRGGDKYIEHAGVVNKLLNLRLLFFILTLGFAMLTLLSLRDPKKVASKEFFSSQVDTILKPILSVELFPNRIYELEIKANSYEIDSVRNISLVVTDENNQILNSFDCSFWHEISLDCDFESCETYTNSNLQNSFRFKVDKPVKVIIHAIQSLESREKKNISLELSLYTILLSRYFLLGLSIFGISLFLLQRYLKRNYWWHSAFKRKENKNKFD